MYTAFFDINHLIAVGAFPLFLVFFLYVWTLWTAKILLARRYRPYEDREGLTTALTTSVIIPVYNEPESVFRTVLAAVAANQPTEIIVVVDGGDAALAAVAAEHTSKVISIPKSGKRQAIVSGLKATAANDIVLVLDSDTVWAPGMLTELLKPFADPRVGGVTPTQRILNPDGNRVRRLADWIEDLRYALTVPAQSIFGQVGCLAGRTIAYRRAAFEEAATTLTAQNIMGVRMFIGDDRVLTASILRAGWRTVFQSTALVWTDAPNTWRRFWHQQLRWGRSSQRETLLAGPWLLRKPAAAAIFFTDIITPFFFCALVALAITHGLDDGGANYLPRLGVPLALLAAYLGMTASIGLRQIPHFRRKRSDLLHLPLFVLQLTFFMLPTRIIAFATMFHNDWGPRGDVANPELPPHERGDLRGRQSLLNLLSILLALIILTLIVFTVRADAATPAKRIFGISGTSIIYHDLSSLHPSVRTEYIDFGQDLVPQLQSDMALKTTPMFTWQPLTVSLTQIAAGAEDAYLIRTAQQVRSYRGPVYIRFAQEMNGNWFPWGAQPAAFIAAWRHIWTIFHQQGASNVRWIWAPDLLTNDTQAQFESATAAYWPGASYVNVVGATLVQFASESSCEIACRFQRIDWLHSQYRQPLWLAEVKVDAAERYPWLTSLGVALATRPWVAALIWTETPSRGQGLGQADTGNMNWTLTTDARARRLMAAAVAATPTPPRRKK
jgi:hyaluronan synthase